MHKIILAFVCLLPWTTYAKPVWVAGWQSSTGLSLPRASAASVVHRGYIYMIGGIDGRDFLASVEFSHVDADGNLSTWRLTTAMPKPRGFISAAVLNDRLYVVGGGRGGHGKQLLNSVISAPVLAKGQLGGWRQETTTLLPRRCSKLFVWNNALYTLGGFGGNLLDSVERALLVDDQLQAWQLSTPTLTMPRYVNAVQRVGEQVFVVGGHHPEQGVGLASTEWADLTHQASVTSIGPNWSRGTALRTERYGLSLVAHDNRLYALGGISGAEYLASIEQAAIDVDKGLTPWKLTTALPIPLANFTAVVVNDTLYVIGGTTLNGYRHQVVRTQFSQQGKLGYWGTAAEAKQALQSNQFVSLEGKLPNSGLLLEMIDTQSYVYLKVKVQQNITWLAAPKAQYRVGANIRFSDGVLMSNFFSQSLQRQFNRIRFVSRVKVVENY